MTVLYWCVGTWRNSFCRWILNHLYLISAPSTAEASDLWPVSTEQPPTTSGCRNAGPASPCWSNYPGQEGRLIKNTSTSGCFCYQLFSHIVFSSFPTARAFRWGDIWRGRGGGNGRGAFCTSDILTGHIHCFPCCSKYNNCSVAAGHWPGPRSGSLRHERGGAGRWKKVWGWWDRKRKSGHPRKDSEKPETGSPERETFKCFSLASYLIRSTGNFLP